jgi:hypothetical protein
MNERSAPGNGPGGSPGNLRWRYRSANKRSQNKRLTHVLHKPDKLIGYRQWASDRSQGWAPALFVAAQHQSFFRQGDAGRERPELSIKLRIVL